MAQYRTPLPRILASVLEGAINRLLAMDEQSRERLQVLHNRVLQLDLEGVAITLFIAFSDDKVGVQLQNPNQPDTVISGSPLALFSMAAPGESKRWGMPGSPVTISGDAALARDLERLFSRLDPDWEGRLAVLFGDVWGYQIASGLRNSAEQAKTVADTGGELFRDYLSRHAGVLVPRDEFRGFADAVDLARDAADRLEARLRIALERQP